MGKIPFSELRCLEGTQSILERKILCRANMPGGRPITFWEGRKISFAALRCLEEVRPHFWEKRKPFSVIRCEKLLGLALGLFLGFFGRGQGTKQFQNNIKRVNKSHCPVAME